MRNKNQLGCFTWPAILATVITFFVITGAVLNAGQGLFSPGQLNAQPGAPLGNVSSHAQISDCEQCHVAPWDADSMQDRCLRCHADIWLEFSDPHKLHGILLNLWRVSHRTPRPRRRADRCDTEQFSTRTARFCHHLAQENSGWLAL
jgi:hypothetical protein